MRRALALCVAGFLAACGGSDGEAQPPTDVMVGGPSPVRLGVAVASPVSGRCVWSHGATTVDETGIRISSYGDVCGLAQTGDWKAGETFVEVLVGSAGENPPPLAVGTYTIGRTSGPGLGEVHEVQVSLVHPGGAEACSRVTDAAEAGGTVTITAISQGTVTGRLDAFVSPDTTLTGGFTAAGCTIPPPVDMCGRMYPPYSGVCRP